MELSVVTRDAADRTVVAVTGEVDVYTAPELDGVLVGLIDGGRARLVVDLTAVEFLDSTGLGVLVKALKRAREQDGALDLVVTRDRIRKVFVITGLDAVMPLHSTVTDALEGEGAAG